MTFHKNALQCSLDKKKEAVMLKKFCFSLLIFLLALPIKAEDILPSIEVKQEDIYVPLSEDVKLELVRNIQKRYEDTTYEQRQTRRKMANRILRKAQQHHDYEMVERFQLELNVIDYYDAKENMPH